jgi:hypothetical protein
MKIFQVLAPPPRLYTSDADFLGWQEVSFDSMAPLKPYMYKRPLSLPRHPGDIETFLSLRRTLPEDGILDKEYLFGIHGTSFIHLPGKASFLQRNDTQKKKIFDLTTYFVSLFRRTKIDIRFW